MKILFRLTYYVWMLCLLFSSCRSDKDYPEAMQKAIACMESHPDSAQIYLASLDKQIAGESEETQMYYALLTTQAADKLYQMHTTDTIMKQVVDFYQKEKDPVKLLLAHFYLGSVYRDLHDAPRALRSFQQALLVGKGSEQYDVMARIYYQIGLLFAYQDLYRESLIATRQAMVYYQKAHDAAGVAYTYRNMARSYEYLEMPDSTHFYYRTAYTHAKTFQEREVANQILDEYLSYLVTIHDIESYQTWVAQQERPKSMENDAIHLCIAGDLFFHYQQSDSARACYEKALKSGLEYGQIYMKSRLYRSLAQLDSLDGNDQAAIIHLRLCLDCEDSIKLLSRTASVAKIHALYNYQHVEAENQQLFRENEQMKYTILQITIGLLVMLLCCSLILFYFYRQKQQKEFQLMLLQRQKEEQKKDVQTTLNEQTTPLEDMEAQLRESTLFKNLHQSSYWEENCLSDEQFNDLQKRLDLTNQNFTGRLRSLSPTLTDIELRVCCLLKIEIPLPGIAKLVGRSPSGISRIRKRLYTKLLNEEGTAEQFDSFILHF